MKTALCLVLALFVVADGMPVSSNPDGTVSSLSLAKGDIQSAETDLKQMDYEQNQELQEMVEIKSSIKNFEQFEQYAGNEGQEQTQVYKVAQVMVKEENKAIIEEQKQQTRATDAYAQVQDAINTLTRQEPGLSQEPGISLGEQQAPSAGDQQPLNQDTLMRSALNGDSQALNQLSQVASLLKQGTQTSNTMHKIEHMQKEAKQLMQQSYQGYMYQTNAASDSLHDPVLGEGHPNDESALAALSHLEGTANKEGGDESALAALSHVQANEGTANKEGGDESALAAEAEAEALSHPASQASNDVSTETQELQNIMTEEGQVESSEKAGLHEVHKLLHKLG